MRVFLDRNVISASVRIKESFMVREIEWGDQKFNVQVAGWKGKPRRNGDHAWLYPEICNLPTLAKLAREGKVELCISNETHFESLSTGLEANGTKGNIFAGVSISRMEDALDRSCFQKGDIGILAARERVIEFCELLKACTWGVFEKIPEVEKYFPEFTLKNLQSLNRFHQILDQLPHRRHWPDAFQLWSAEVHSARYFVSLDRRFINKLKESSQLELPCKPVFPSELLYGLGVTEIEPMPIEGTDFIDFTSMID